jgi:hypothetical protein
VEAQTDPALPLSSDMRGTQGIPSSLDSGREVLGGLSSLATASEHLRTLDLAHLDGVAGPLFL